MHPNGKEGGSDGGGGDGGGGLGGGLGGGGDGGGGLGGGGLGGGAMATFGVYCEIGFSNTCVVEPDSVNTNSYPCFNGSVQLPVLLIGGATLQ